LCYCTILIFFIVLFFIFSSIFFSGGLAYTRGGQGEKVERLYREVRAYAIPAGSEEIMLDLGIRQALKGAAKTLKAKI
jgi:alkylation response protein AidB-like acyl-CoA dehydrogenase